MKLLITAILSTVYLLGCREEGATPIPEHVYTAFNQDYARYRYLPPNVAEEEIALDILEDRLMGGNNMADDASTKATQKLEPSTEIETSEGVTVDDVQEVTGFSKWVLNSRAWLFFLAYCLVAFIAVWYTKTTGKESETLTKIQSALNERLTSKQRTLYRILKKWWEKLCKKKQS